jgi:hypothetical protein
MKTWLGALVAAYLVGAVFWAAAHYLILVEERKWFDPCEGSHGEWRRKLRSLAIRVVTTPLWPAWAALWAARELRGLLREIFDRTEES